MSAARCPCCGGAPQPQQSASTPRLILRAVDALDVLPWGSIESLRKAAQRARRVDPTAFWWLTKYVDGRRGRELLVDVEGAVRHLDAVGRLSHASRLKQLAESSVVRDTRGGARS